MNKLQRDILFWLKENRKERGMSVPQIAIKVNRNESTVRVELGILAENNLIEVDLSPTRKIRRVRITSNGEIHLKDKTTIVTKETIKFQVSEIKQRLSALEKALEEVHTNPTEQNKQSFLDKANTFQSVANGVAPWVKTGIEIFKSW
jgi:predicted transcriptional regulator